MPPCCSDPAPLAGAERECYPFNRDDAKACRADRLSAFRKHSISSSAGSAAGSPIRLHHRSPLTGLLIARRCSKVSPPSTAVASIAVQRIELGEDAIYRAAMYAHDWRTAARTTPFHILARFQFRGAWRCARGVRRAALLPRTQGPARTLFNHCGSAPAETKDHDCFDERAQSVAHRGSGKVILQSENNVDP